MMFNGHYKVCWYNNYMYLALSFSALHISNHDLQDGAFVVRAMRIFFLQWCVITLGLQACVPFIFRSLMASSKLPTLTMYLHLFFVVAVQISHFIQLLSNVYQ